MHSICFRFPRQASFWLCALLFPLVSSAQSDLRVGDWKSYASFGSGISGAMRDSILYVTTTGGLYSYDTRTGAYRTFSRLDGLSRVNADVVYHHEATGNLFLGYADGTVDVLSPALEVTALSDIARNDFYTAKGINAIAGDANRLFFCTDFGIVVYDVKTLLPQFTIAQFGSEASRLAVTAVTLFQGRVWASVTGKGLYSAALTFPNLSDPTAWRKENGRDNMPANATVAAVGALGNRLYAACNDVLRYRENNTWISSPTITFPVANLSVLGNTISSVSGGAVHIFDQNGIYEQRFYADGGMQASFPTTNATYYIDFYRGLARTRNTSAAVESLRPNGPPSPNCRKIAAANGRIYVAPGGEASADYSGVYYHRPLQGWTQLTRGAGLPPNRASANYARVFYDAAGGQAWLGSWGVGLAVVEDSTYTAFYDCNNAPTGISRAYSFCDSTSLDNSRVSGIWVDDRENTWLSFSYGNAPLSCLAKDGTWYSFLGGSYSYADMRDVIVDDFESKWLIRSKSGLLVFSDKGTLANTADDKVVAVTAGSGRGNLPSDNVYALAEDRNGYVWVGTDKGVAVFYDTYSFTQGKIADASLPIFEGRELFRYETINAIVVDGGNRKWFGTNSGLFLLSPDGTKMLAKYTMENSPLPSNIIISLAVDQHTGEVLVGTDRGIISYRGDATEPATTCDDLIVFPNPVYKDQVDKIAIRGALNLSLVRITDVAGGLVRELTAQGGTAAWDGFDTWGNKVQPGLYQALITKIDGSGACATTFSILE